MKLYTLVFLLCAGAGAHGALAQNALPIAAEPLVYRTHGEVQGCGVQLTGGEVNNARASFWFDVSFNIFRRGIALAQAIAYEISSADPHGESRTLRVPLQSTWLRAGTGEARLGENTEQHDSLIYRLEAGDALALFEAVARGEALSLGVKRWGQRVESVYSGVPALTDATREQLGACLASLSE